jgi:hypothetical protein
MWHIVTFASRGRSDLFPAWASWTQLGRRRAQALKSSGAPSLRVRGGGHGQGVIWMEGSIYTTPLVHELTPAAPEAGRTGGGWGSQISPPLPSCFDARSPTHEAKGNAASITDNRCTDNSITTKASSHVFTLPPPPLPLLASIFSTGSIRPYARGASTGPADVARPSDFFFVDPYEYAYVAHTRWRTRGSKSTRGVVLVLQTRMEGAKKGRGLPPVPCRCSCGGLARRTAVPAKVESQDLNWGARGRGQASSSAGGERQQTTSIAWS